MNTTSKTKIIATIGPSSWSEDTLSKMITSGMQLARINASFADFTELERVSTLIRRLSPRIGIILDTKGNKIRVKGLTKEIKIENRLIISSVESNNPNVVLIDYPNLHLAVTKDALILLDDGNIQLKVSKISGTEILCDVIQGGILKPNKTVNIPAISLSFPTLSEKDKADIQFATQHNFDFISASFVRNKEDIKIVRDIIGNSHLKIIAKIENGEGVKNFDEILQATDAIMVARGDMGNEMDLEEVPIIQKQLIYKCRAAGKPVIVATQMLESMRENIRPTRAEVSDVANAVMDGADCLMLSAETSTGKYPIQAITMMNKIALKTEKVMQASPIYGRTSASEVVDELGKDVCHLAESIPLKAILIISDNSSTIGSVSRHRPNIPIYVVSSSIENIRQNIIYRGVKTFYIEEFSTDRDFNTAKAIEKIYANGELDLGDKIAIISGSSIKNKSTDSILEIVTIKDILNS